MVIFPKKHLNYENLEKNIKVQISQMHFLIFVISISHFWGRSLVICLLQYQIIKLNVSHN